MHRLLSLLTALFLILQATCLQADADPASSSKPAPQIQTIPVPPLDNEPVFPLNIEEPARQNEKFFTEFLNMLATLGFIIALILIIAWFLKRLMNTRLEQMNSTSLIKVVERRTLSPKTSLYLLEVDDKTILIAETNHGVTCLSEYVTPVEEPENAPTTEFPSPFSKMLEKNKG